MVINTSGDWTFGTYLSFKDEGPVSPGSVTRRFTIRNRQSGALLGYIKWFNQWRKYCFFPVEAVFDENCLQDVIDFCRSATQQHRNKRS